MRTAVALWVLTSASLLAQAPPAFEVATVKVNRTSEPLAGGFEHGRLRIRSATLRELVGAAYDVRIDLVVDGPGWLDVDRFDIEGKADAVATEAESRVMLRTLLAERFQLKTHREARMKPVYVLTVARGGPLLRDSPAGSTERPRCSGTGPVNCYQRTMAQFADFLPRIGAGVDRPVTDETGLRGRYDFTLAFARPPAEDGLAIFRALPRQLGLQLTEAKRPIEYLVIDGANRTPTEN